MARRGVGHFVDRLVNRPLIGGLRAELRAVELGIEAPELHEGIVGPPF